MATVYTAKNFFDGVSLRHNVRVQTENGIVVGIEDLVGIPSHYLVAPGFIDVQMNGFASVDVASASVEEFRNLDEELLRKGTTSWLATIVTAPLERMSMSLRLIEQSMNATSTGCLGAHVEGPFLGGAPGAHNPAWIIPFDSAWSETLPSIVRMMTMAPEQSGVISEAIPALRERGITVSLGHTRASHQEFTAAVEAGARMVTHLFNGMSGVHHRDGGIALSALVEHRVVVGLIADLCHVAPDAVNLAFKSKGPSGVCLVSDSVAWESEWAQRRGVQIRDGAPRLQDGTLAGSCTPLAECVRNAVVLCGVPLVDALSAATRTPADLLGFPQKGRIVVGQQADLVVLDEELSVVEARRGLVSIRG